MTRPGWIRLPRALLSEPWYRDAPALVRALHQHLLLSANFAPSTTRIGLNLKPGQTVTSWPALADALACREKGRVVKPTVAKVRRAAALLENAGEATVCATGRPAYTGIVVTLERWALYAGESDEAADVAADVATDRLPDMRQHYKKEDLPSAEGQPVKGNNADEILRRTAAARRIREAQDMAELKAIREREARHITPHDAAATEGSVN